MDNIEDIINFCNNYDHNYAITLLFIIKLLIITIILMAFIKL